MTLQIEPSIARNLPIMVKEPLANMPPAKQSVFVEEYKRRRKSKVLMFVLAILFPIQLFLLGKTGLGIVFWLTGGGMGIWWFIEVFLTSRRVSEFRRVTRKRC